MTYSLIDHALMITQPHTYNESLEDLKDLVVPVILRHYEITEEEFKQRTRVRPIPEARFVYFFCLMEPLPKSPGRRHTLYKYTLNEVAGTLEMDHATVLHGMKYVANMISVDRIARRRFEYIFANMATMGYDYPMRKLREIVEESGDVKRFRG